MICPNCQREIDTSKGNRKYYACKCGASLAKGGDELTIFKMRPDWGSLTPEPAPPKPKK